MMIAYFNGPQDWRIIALIVLVTFGGSKIPQLAKGLGEGIREFKRNTQGLPRVDLPRGDEPDVNKWDTIIVVVLLLIIVILGILLFTV